ncbi:uncharacterized protein LOC143476112 [Brachyhypopomus gauderio]|uniref:uncharacterized protein LOC143476112 n=1 Tax=Brachyhypopomus gauderio TaxID=698409 RepID=UPI0040416108
MLTQKVQDVHQTSFLPPILDPHLLPESFRKTAKAVTQKRKLKVGGARELSPPPISALDSDRVAEIRKKALRDQRHLETYRNIHRLRDILSRHYAELLKENVKRQRHEIKQPTSAALTTTERPNEQRSTSQKLLRSTLHHDDAFLRSLPKTRHYLVLELRRRLGQRGCLQGSREQEAFRLWVDQHQTAQLEKQLQQIALRSCSAPELTMENLLKIPSAPPKVQVSADASPAHRRRIAVAEGGGRREQTQTQNQNQTQVQTLNKAEPGLPKVFLQEFHVPTCYSLQPSFLENFSTKTLSLRVEEPLCPSRAATTMLYKLRLMHHMSLSHMDHARRLLDTNGLTSQCDSVFSIKDLLELVCPNKVVTTRPRTPGEAPPPHPLRDEAITGDTQELRTPADEVASSQDPEGSKFCSSRISTSCGPEQPLSIQDIQDMSSRCLPQSNGLGGKMWTNYV